jgi:hypothetical protein
VRQGAERIAPRQADKAGRSPLAGVWGMVHCWRRRRSLSRTPNTEKMLRLEPLTTNHRGGGWVIGPRVEQRVAPHTSMARSMTCALQAVAGTAVGAVTTAMVTAAIGEAGTFDVSDVEESRGNWLHSQRTKRQAGDIVDGNPGGQGREQCMHFLVFAFCEGSTRGL